MLPRLSNLEFLILELLLNNPSSEMYGLELVEASNGRLKRGTVYITLQRMADKSLVESYREDPGKNTGPPRRMYRMTGHGQRVFQALASSRAALSEALA